MSQADLDKLAIWRTVGARHSEDVVNLAPKLLASGIAGDTEWAVREQLAIAALDLGKIKIADAQLQALEHKFAHSPRVDILLGLKLEVVGQLDAARQMYDSLLRKDECNVAAHQRMIALSLASSPQEAIAHLLRYLDTFYSDPQGWSLLAQLYADQGAYGQSLAALGHLSVLQTWDSLAIERAGETAYTMGDYQLALKYFLRATEMDTPPTGQPESRRSRSWWGVKLATKRLLDPSTKSETAVPRSEITSPDLLQKLNVLATERILAVGGARLYLRRKVLAGDELIR